MLVKSARSLVVFALFFCFVVPPPAPAQDLRIPIPTRSKATPVQKLNRDGVKALRKNNVDKAKQFFYRAYLLDPNDPFTLNNLGYIAELEGEAERAQRYYELAMATNSEATVDRSVLKDYEGKTVASVAGRAEEGHMTVNRLNVEAIALLQQDRIAEADAVLHRALRVDAQNPFTLNNLGFAREKQGEYDAAYAFYTRSASQNSRERIVVTAEPRWRGRRISDVAQRNARNVRRLMEESRDVDSQVALLNLRGVSAINRNERRLARGFFEQAYKLNPRDSFTLNNMGYLAELEGDRETANFYYARARESQGAGNRVEVATRREAEGQRMGQVAQQNDAMVQAQIQTELAERRRRGTEPVLRTREGDVVRSQPPADDEERPDPELKPRP